MNGKPCSSVCARPGGSELLQNLAVRRVYLEDHIGRSIVGHPQRPGGGMEREARNALEGIGEQNLSRIVRSESLDLINGILIPAADIKNIFLGIVREAALRDR